jgi:5'-3' exonuclease
MIYLIDASVFVFRAWFSIPDSMTDEQRNPVNAVYGFARFLGDFLEEIQPDFVAAAFDESLTTSFRNEIYPDYKANREPAPPELKRQFELCRRVTRALGVMDCGDPSYEADDLIGTIAFNMRDAGHSMRLVTRDKDLLQLLRDGDEFWDFVGNRTISYDGVADFLGVRAEQVVDFLALAGDSVDNIPGVPGIGSKTAIGLLAHYDSVDQLFDNLEDVSGLPLRGAGKIGERLAAHRENVELYRQLTRIRCDAPVASHEAALTRTVPDLDVLNGIYDEVGFGTALRRQAARIADRF